ncbi:IS3 family transposase [Ruminococcaceae bacterium OttesenSCG-928-A11]|nr:IS3 family transposase [Ruminococcaceae bacterium OttesenSCG-928-A11]
MALCGVALEQLYGQYNVHVLCESLDVSRGTFYNHIKRNKRGKTMFAERREELRELIQNVYDGSNQVFCAPKIRAVLADRGHLVSVKMVTELMRKMGLYSIRTTVKKNYNRLNEFEKRTNVLQRDFHADAPNQVWVSDVSCFKVKDKYYYICVVIDLFSRKVVSHKVSLQHSTKLISSTFRDAYAQRKPIDSLIFHSDRGTQYTAYSFQKLLREKSVTQSFSNPGSPHDNAVAESFFASNEARRALSGAVYL